MSWRMRYRENQNHRKFKAKLWDLGDKIVVEVTDIDLAEYLTCVLGGLFRSTYTDPKYKYAIEYKKTGNPIADEILKLRITLVLKEVV